MKMKETAENYLGKMVKDAVITVPAYFNDSQRQATKDAGRIAGLNVRRIINEPTAASLAFGIKSNQKDKLIAVFDLGGGTFDISILEVDDGVFEVKATNGDTSCGGEDVDSIIQQYLIDEFRKQTGANISQDQSAKERVREAAEKAKVELSSTKQTRINLPYLTFSPQGPKNLMMDLSRSKLEQLTEKFLLKTIKPCQQCLKDAKIKKADITDLLLVGGMTRMPLVQRIVQDFFKIKPNKSLNPDEAVAIGAAIQGSIMEGSFKGDLIMLDVTPLSLGIETMGGVFSKLIGKNTTIPTKKNQIYTTAVDNQTQVQIKVFQGERPLVQQNHFLGQFNLIGIPPSQRQVPQIQVEFDIDANGIMNVSAKDLATGKNQSIVIKSSGGLSEQEIQNMEKEAEKMKDEDQKLKEVIDWKNKSDNLIFSTEKHLEQNKKKLKKELVKKIRAKIDDLQKVAKKSKDPKKIQEAYEALNKVSTKIGEELYKQQGGQQHQEGHQQEGQQEGEQPGQDGGKKQEKKGGKKKKE